MAVDRLNTELPLAPDNPDAHAAVRRLVARMAPDDADLMLDALGLAGDEAEDLPDDTWLSTAQAARQLGVSVHTVRDYVKKGWLTAVRQGAGHPLLINPGDVRQMTDARNA